MRPGVTARLVALVILAATAAVTLISQRPPAPLPADAPPTAFSAERALPLVADLAREPRPLGSAANARVRDDLAARLTALGLTTAVRDGNVVATLPGAAPTGQVVLSAHHDSVPQGPGAADDAAGVASILETVRALRTGPPLRNDLTVLLTDGEEAGLLGMRRWVRTELPRAPIVVLNQEARGVTGPALLFRTSPGNAGLVEAMRAVPHPAGDSGLVAIFRLLPNDTDLSVVLGAGRPGIDSAFIEGPEKYHTAADSPANLDPRSVQSQGGTLLALARELGGTDLAPLDPTASGLPARPDAVYFPLGDLLVTYPVAWEWPLALLAVAGLVAVTLAARHRGRTTARGALLAVVTSPLPLVVAAALAVGLWQVLLVLRPAYADTGPFLDRPGPYQVATGALAVLAVLAWYLPVRRRVGRTAATVGAAGLLAALGVLTAATVPGASFLVTWPALGLVAGLAVAVALRDGDVATTTAGAVAAVPAVVFLAPFAVASFGIGGVATPVPAVAFALLGLSVAAVLDPSTRDRRDAVLPATALTAAVAATAAGLLTG
ncbi:M28 family peptidase [Actinomycetospora soli]|uniref:M28 family peptidase n=1 Tax=Actinomycetospora soli TaxID=2893887 RepID=UPI001E60483D|nr:M20/M25/M40 family metallo-hydrolase [Actinomycetospora soli]MCD2186868.1 M20/M25/M40 family metallo-hydrolase [Actinomycetospora soli]